MHFKVKRIQGRAKKIQCSHHMYVLNEASQFTPFSGQLKFRDNVLLKVQSHKILGFILWFIKVIQYSL
jgi:hypothetical protein